MFPLVDRDTGLCLMARNTVGPVVSAIGRKAGVVVGQADKLTTEGGKRVQKAVKMFAGEHDLAGLFAPDGRGRLCPRSYNGWPVTPTYRPR